MKTEQRHLDIVHDAFVSQVQRLLLDYNTNDSGHMCSTLERLRREFLELTFEPA